MQQSKRFHFCSDQRKQSVGVILLKLCPSLFFSPVLSTSILGDKLSCPDLLTPPVVPLLVTGKHTEDATDGGGGETLTVNFT